MERMATSLTKRPSSNREGAMEKVTRCYELLRQLQALPLVPLDEARLNLASVHLDKVFQSLTMALSILKPTTTQHGCTPSMAVESMSSARSSDHGSEVCLKRTKLESGGDRDQRLHERRKDTSSRTKITCAPLDDGYQWRKYGQKKIGNHKFVRDYYRCTYSDVQKCLARKQVDKISDDSDLFGATYYEEHTCNTLVSIPQPVLESHPKEPCLISFESSPTNGIKEGPSLSFSLTSAHHDQEGQMVKPRAEACSSLNAPVPPADTTTLESNAMGEQFWADTTLMTDMNLELLTKSMDRLLSGTCMSPTNGIKEGPSLLSSLTSAHHDQEGQMGKPRAEACSSLNAPVSPADTTTLGSTAMGEQFLAVTPLMTDMNLEMVTTQEPMEGLIFGTCMSPSSHEWGMSPLWM